MIKLKTMEFSFCEQCLSGTNENCQTIGCINFGVKRIHFSNTQFPIGNKTIDVPPNLISDKQFKDDKLFMAEFKVMAKNEIKKFVIKKCKDDQNVVVCFDLKDIDSMLEALFHKNHLLSFKRLKKIVFKSFPSNAILSTREIKTEIFDKLNAYASLREMVSEDEE